MKTLKDTLTLISVSTISNALYIQFKVSYRILIFAKDRQSIDPWKRYHLIFAMASWSIT